MKIVIISFTGTVAVTNYLSQLSCALSEIDNVTVIIPKSAKVENFNKKIKFIRFPFPLNPVKAMIEASNPFLYTCLIEKIKKISPDVIHIVFELRFPFFFELLLRRICPVIVTVHEPKPLPVNRPIRPVMDSLQVINCILLVRFSDKTIVHGNTHKRYLMDRGTYSSKIEIVTHGDFSSNFIKWKKEEINISNGHNVLFFGRIEPYKGIEYLIESGKVIKKYIPDIKITIAGSGDFSKYWRLINGDLSFIIINKFISEKEASELFKKTSLVVLPYIDGSQSGIITIAYGFKKPVIATDVGNFKDMVVNGKTGFVVPPKDVKGLSEAMIRLLKNTKLRKEMGENGYNLLKKKFNWYRIAEKIEKIYEELVFNKS